MRIISSQLASSALAWCVLIALAAESTSASQERLPSPSQREESPSPSSGDLSGEAEQLAGLVECIGANRDRRAERVVELAEEALRLLSATPDLEVETYVRNELSWALSKEGDTERALQEALLARGLSKQTGDRAACAKADYNIAVAHWYRAELEQAFEAIERARPVHEELGDERALATTLTLAGAIHRSRSAYDDALACHIRALEISERAGDPEDIARSKNNIALIYWNLGQHERALESMLPVIDVHRTFGNRDALATALSNTGLIYIELDQPQVALPFLMEGLEIYGETGTQRGKTKLLSNLGFAYETLGDYEKALQYHFEGLELRERLDDRWGLSRALANIAGVYVSKGRFDEGLNYYSSALEHAKAADARNEQAQILKGLARVHSALGNTELALASLRRHIEVTEELNTAEMMRTIAELEAQEEISTAERELERERSRRTLLLVSSGLFAFAAFALFAIYRSRARSLAEVRRSHGELELATARLLESEQRYRSVFEDAKVPKLLFDLETQTVLDANGSAARLSGRSPEDLQGATLERLQPSWLGRGLGRMGEAVTAESCRFEEWTDEDGAQRYSELWAAPLQQEGRSCALVTVRDVTADHKRDEDRIRIDKLESLGLLAGGIAHDFNNALTAVLGHVSLARHKAGEELWPLLDATESAVGQAAHLTSQLLAFARGGAPQRQLSDVKALLREAVHFGLSGSNVRVEFDVAPNLWTAELDHGQFKQVISNLAINADQAMRKGGRLIVRARNVLAQQPLSTTAGPGSYVQIQIEDDGPGIPSEIQDKVLDPYFTTKDTGSGLGLATVFAVVSRHQGWMEFESRSGKGTTFSLYFPASTERPVEVQEPARSRLNGSGAILVMDDDAQVQTIYRSALTALGYDVDVVADGRTAVDRWVEAREAGHGYDLVIMDLTIPGGMGGRDAMAELRRRDPRALGIVASGYSKDPVMSRYREAGFAGSLAKPFKIDELGRLIARVLQQRGQGVSEPAARA